MRYALLLVFLFSGPLTFAQSRTNPDVSVNFLGLYLSGNGVPRNPLHNPRKGPSLQEAEIQFFSDVDAYLRANAIFAVGPSATGEHELAPEEVFIETTALPWVTLRAGKMKMAMGKHNRLHTHAFPFLDAPLILQNILSDEGLNESGLSAAFLLPTSWYSELTLQAMSLQNEALYASSDAGALGSVVNWKNLWDLTEDLTLEMGLSSSQGANQFHRVAYARGADLTFKWRPSRGNLHRALIWSTEYLAGHRPGLRVTENDPLSASAEDLAGYATWLQIQFAPRWWAQARYEQVGTVRSEGLPSQTKRSFLVGFFPTEFSGFRVQYDHLRTQGIATPEDRLGLQFNVTIGTHPAHGY